MSRAKAQPNLDNVAKVLWTLIAPFRELKIGAKVGSIPTSTCLAIGVLTTLLINLSIDEFIWKKLGILNLYPRTLLWYTFYYYIWLFSGFLGWGCLQAALRKKLIERLSEVFISAGLKSPSGKLPGFIYDRPVDCDSRCMALAKHTISAERFNEAKTDLESGLQIYVDEIRDIKDKGIVKIFYSHLPMPELVKAKDIDRQRPLTFLVGETRSKLVKGSIKDTPHMLIGGTSGYGKSTFLRQMITTLYLNNKDIDFYLFDFKFGLEFQLFDNLPRVNVIDNIDDGVAYLKQRSPELDFRGKLMRKLKCNEFSQIQRKSDDELRAAGFEPKDVRKLKREVIVVDEVAELTLTGGGVSTEKIQAARSVINRIARLGRAGGLHLILATQRPDVKAVDGQIKSNLPARLAFYMSDQASSKTILDRARAAELPNIKGRAVWRDNGYHELQTSYLDEEETKKLLEPYYSKATKKVIKVKSANTPSKPRPLNLSPEVAAND